MRAVRLAAAAFLAALPAFCAMSGAKNLWTVREYTNFVIRFDVKLPPNANNGLGIRTPPNEWCSREGMELQLLDDWGDLYNGSNRLADVHYTGAIYGVVPPARKVNGESYLKRPGEWNSVEVTADGPRVRFVLNGATLVAVEQGAARDRGMPRKGAGTAGDEVGDARSGRGHSLRVRRRFARHGLGGRECFRVVRHRARKGA